MHYAKRTSLFDFVEDVFNNLLPEVDNPSQYKEFNLELPLPGITKDDLTIEIKHNSLSIKVNNLKDATGYRALYSDRKYLYHLTNYHDLESIDAVMLDGLLKIGVPLKTEVKGKIKTVAIK